MYKAVPFLALSAGQAAQHLWIKTHLMHRRIFHPLVTRLIDRAQAGFSTGLRAYLPMQKLEKIRPSRSSELKAPVISPNACWA